MLSASLNICVVVRSAGLPTRPVRRAHGAALHGPGGAEDSPRQASARRDASVPLVFTAQPTQRLTRVRARDVHQTGAESDRKKVRLFYDMEVFRVQNCFTIPNCSTLFTIWNCSELQIVYDTQLF